MRLLPRPATWVPVLLGLLLAVTLTPVLAGPARAATVVVTGKVTGLNASGVTVPIEDVFIEANQADGSPLEPRAYAYTEADGTYALTLPATGSYQVVMECWGSYACAQEWAPEPPLTRSFSGPTVLDGTLERFGRITGTVKKDGVATPWPNGRITANNDERHYWGSPEVSIDGAGKFTIEKVAPGTVELWGTEGYDVENFLSIVDGQTFTVAPGATEDISLAVEDWPGFYVAAVDPANGAPLVGIGWQLYSRPVGGTWDNGLQMGPLLTDDEGRMMYRISDKTLEYTVCFAGTTDVPVTQRRVKRCLGDAPDLASATAWKWSASQPKLKTNIGVPLPFATVGTPTISGTAKVDGTLTASAGTWTPAPTTTTYEWFRAGTTAAVGTGATYKPVAADAGKTLTVKATGVRSGYVTASATSAPTAVVAQGAFTTVAPAISGTAKVDGTLTASAGTWTPAPTTTTYEWFRAGTTAAVGTGATYKPVAADAGKTLTVKATGVREGYATASATSAPTAAVAPGTFATVAPTVSGTPRVGSTLRAAPGTWTPAATGTTYQWLRAGVEIPGATAATYDLVAADAGRTLTVRVTGTRSGYTTATATSVATGQVAEAAFTTVPTPTITGIPAVGTTLTADAGTWLPARETTSYQWFRSGVAIPGATGATYLLTAADAGAVLTVRVTGGRDGYGSSEATSAATAPVGLAAFAQAPIPKITGKAKVRAKLKAVVGTWSPTPATTTYQWFRNGKAVKGATKPVYKVTAKDRRKRITVVVTQSLPGYTAVSQKSAATKRIR